MQKVSHFFFVQDDLNVRSTPESLSNSMSINLINE